MFPCVHAHDQRACEGCRTTSNKAVPIHIQMCIQITTYIYICIYLCFFLIHVQHACVPIHIQMCIQITTYIYMYLFMFLFNTCTPCTCPNTYTAVYTNNITIYIYVFMFLFNTCTTCMCEFMHVQIGYRYGTIRKIIRDELSTHRPPDSWTSQAQLSIIHSSGGDGRIAKGMRRNGHAFTLQYQGLPGWYGPRSVLEGRRGLEGAKQGYGESTAWVLASSSFWLSS